MCKDDKIAYYKRFGFVELVDPADVPRAMRSMYRFVRAIRRVVGFFFKKMPYLAIMMYVGPSLAKSYYPR